MEPAQLEFAAEEELISILPNFTEAKLYLISVSSVYCSHFHLSIHNFPQVSYNL